MQQTKKLRELLLATQPQQGETMIEQPAPLKGKRLLVSSGYGSWCTEPDKNGWHFEDSDVASAVQWAKKRMEEECQKGQDIMVYGYRECQDILDEAFEDVITK